MVQRIPLLSEFYAEFFSNELFAKFYRGSGWANFGYWQPGVKHADAASDALIEKLFRQIPKKSRFKGRVLDVACGSGASTAWLAERRPARKIHAIGIEESQISAARRRVPNANIEQMDAARLSFADDTFNCVLCIEAAFHFETRAQFLAECYRVLKPGGYLIMSDILMAKGAALVPADNYLEDPTAYAAVVERTGLQVRNLEDATDPIWNSYRRRFSRFLLGQLPAPAAIGHLYIANVISSWAVRRCLLVCAKKPKLLNSGR